MTSLAREDVVADLATIRAMGIEDSDPELTQLLSVAMTALPRVDVVPQPSSDSQIRWQSLLDHFGLTDIAINNLAVWSEVLKEDEHAYRFTLNEN